MLELSVGCERDLCDCELDYSLVDKEVVGWLLLLKEGFKDPEETYGCWTYIDILVMKPATPQGFRELYSEIMPKVKDVVKEGLCSTVPGRWACESDSPNLLIPRVSGAQYCAECCLHLTFQCCSDIGDDSDTDVQ